MLIVKVTPICNVVISKKCFKSDNVELFYNKVFEDDSKVDVYDIKDKIIKLINPGEINSRIHRMLINNKMFFICSMTECRKNA